MPRIPRGDVGYVPPSGGDTPMINADTYVAHYNEVKAFLRTADEVEAKFKALEDTSKAIRFLSDARDELVRLETEAAQTPDIWRFEDRVDDTVRDLFSRVAGLKVSPEVKERINAELSKEIALRATNVKDILRRRKIDYAKGLLIETVDRLKRDYYNAGDDLERGKVLDDLSKVIEANVNAGVIKAEDGVKLFNAFRDEVKRGQVWMDLEVDPETAIKNLKAGKYGLDPETTAKLIQAGEKLLQKRQKVAEEAQREQLEQLDRDLYLRYLEGKLGVDDIGEAVEQGLDPKRADWYLRRITQTTEDRPSTVRVNGRPSGDVETYIDLKRVLPDLPEEEARNRIVDAVRQGKITDADARKLFDYYQKISQQRFKNAVKEETKRLTAWAEQNWQMFLTRMGVTDADKYVTDMLLSETANAKTAKEVREIAEEVKRQIVYSAYPEMAGERVTTDIWENGKLHRVDVTARETFVNYVITGPGRVEVNDNPRYVGRSIYVPELDVYVGVKGGLTDEQISRTLNRFVKEKKRELGLDDDNIRIAVEALKTGFVSGTGGFVGGLGATVSMGGSAIEDAGKFLQESVKKAKATRKLAGLPENLLTEVSDLTNRAIGVGLSRLGGFLKRAGRKVYDYYKRATLDLWELQDESVKNSPIGKVMHIAGSTVPSLTAGVLTAVATRNPYAVAGLFASMATGEGWVEMEEAGKPKVDRILNAIPRFVGDFFINSVELGTIAKVWDKIPQTARQQGLKSAFRWALENIGTTALAEGVQEPLEQIYLNFMDKIGYDPTRQLFSGVLESAVGGLIGGGLAGFGTLPYARVRYLQELYGLSDENVQVIADAISDRIERSPDQVESAFVELEEKGIEEADASDGAVTDEPTIAWTPKPFEETVILSGYEPPPGARIYDHLGRRIIPAQWAKEEGYLLSAKEKALLGEGKVGQEANNTISSASLNVEQEQGPTPEVVQPSKPAPQVNIGRSRVTVKGLRKAQKGIIPRIIRESIPVYQGGKRNLLPYIVPEVGKALEGVKDDIEVVYDLFGGSGLYGLSLVEGLGLNNVKKVVINEANPLRVAGIKYIIENADKTQETLKYIENNLVDEIKKRTSKRGESAGSVSRAIQEIVEQGAEQLPEDVLGFLSNAIARGQASYGSQGKDWDIVLDLLYKTAEDITNAGQLVKRLRSNGIEIEVRQGDAYELGRAIQGRNALVVADPPYYMTKGYGENEVRVDTYRKTAELLKALAQNDANVIYNDSAWWTKESYTKDWREGAQILQAMFSTLDFDWAVIEGVGKGRDEILGVRNAGRKSETAIGSVAGAGDEASGQTGREGGVGGGLQGPKETQGETAGNGPAGISAVLSSEKGQLDISPIVETLSPAVRKLANKIAQDSKNAKDSFHLLFAPQALTELSRQASLTAREAFARLRLAESRFYKHSQETERFFWKLPLEERLKYINAIEEGIEIKDPALAEIYAYHRDLLDQAYKLSQEWDSTIEYIENYFPHIWEDPVKAKSVLEQIYERHGGRRAFKERFARHRKINLIREGLNYGLKLKHTNPEQIVRIRLYSALKASTYARLLAQWKEMGLVTEERISPKQVVIETPDKRYYTSPDVKVIWDRITDVGLFGRKDAVGEVARSALALKNTFSALKLGLSAFHFTMVSLVDVAQKGLVAVNKLASGDLGGAVKTIATNTFKLGGEIERILEFGPKNEEEETIFESLMMAGARKGMPEEFKVKLDTTLQELREKKQYHKVPFALITGVVSKLQEPLMEIYVPRLKLAGFWLEYGDWLARNPHATVEEKRRMASRIWDSIDNRYGEMVYDNMFWPRWMRDIGVMSMLSLGWNLGTIREVGNSFVDLANVIEKARRGEKVDIAELDKAIFIGVYTLVVGAFGALMNKLLSGEWPKQIKDFFYPRTGRTNPDGSEARVLVPAYSKDFVSVANAVQKEGIIKGLVTVGRHKLAPLWASIADVLANRDFYGTMITDPADSIPKQLLDAVLYVVTNAGMPISVSSTKRILESGQVPLREVILSFLGFSQAPSHVVRSKIQNEIYEALYRKAGGALRTKGEAERRRIRKLLVNRMRIGAVDSDLLYQAIRSGALGVGGERIRENLKRLIKEAKIPPDVVAFKHLSNEEKAKLWLEMTDAERLRYAPAMSDEAKRMVINAKIMEVHNGIY